MPYENYFFLRPSKLFFKRMENENVWYENSREDSVFVT